MAEPDDEKQEITPRIRHVPYYNKATLDAGDSVEEKIKEDSVKGLRTVGRVGSIRNEGPGSIEIQTFDSYAWSEWIPIIVGRRVKIENGDNIWWHTMRLKASATEGTTYELLVAPGLEEGSV